MRYEFSKNPPPPIEGQKYYKLAIEEFSRLLKEFPSNEKKFQTFFEQNPCYLPGARGEFDFGPSGHGPFLSALISQPKLNGIATRMPDFMWIANDSLVLNPILIEIESPSKKYFRKDGSPTAQFLQAKNQLDEWKTILSKPENILQFYQDYNLPTRLRNLRFEPWYVLIYGRREEYQDVPWLSQKRTDLLSRTERQILMSYDRLNPEFGGRNYICCNVEKGIYIAKYLSPNFTLNPHQSELIQIKNLSNVIDSTQFESVERKEFLKQKLPVLLSYLNSSQKPNAIEQIFGGENIQFFE